MTRVLSGKQVLQVQQARELLNADRRFTRAGIAQEVDISVGSVHTVLRNKLKMRKISARLVPQGLTSDNATPHTSQSETSFIADDK